MIYNHCFSGNRLEGVTLLEFIEPGCSLLVYDIRGAGNNESKYVTLGLRESFDLDRILSHLMKAETYSQYVLWGRSMGAVTIIHYLHQLHFN